MKIPFFLCTRTISIERRIIDEKNGVHGSFDWNYFVAYVCVILVNGRKWD